MCINLLRFNNEVGIILPWPIAFVVRYREPKALVLDKSKDIICAIKKIRELLFKVRMARHLISVASLAFCKYARPLEAA
jgi:hypothetical protein